VLSDMAKAKRKSSSQEARFKRCKQKLMSKGYSKSARWAICTTTVGNPKNKTSKNRKKKRRKKG